MIRKLKESLGASDPKAAEIIVPRLVELFAPKSVVDFGCGSGTWVKEFAFHGVEAIGFDSRPPEGAQFRQCNLERDMPSARGDMALCLEVAEHLSSSREGNLIDALCKFDVAIPSQGGWGHVNEQWPDHWANLFAFHGYACSEDLRWEFWERKEIPAWYRQDLLVFARPQTLAKFGLRQSEPRPVVHPDVWLGIGAMGIMQRLARLKVPAAVAALLLAYLAVVLFIRSQS